MELVEKGYYLVVLVSHKLLTKTYIKMKTLIKVMVVGSLATFTATCLFAILERCIGLPNLFIILTCIVAFSAILLVFYQIGQSIDKKKRHKRQSRKFRY